MNMISGTLRVISRPEAVGTEARTNGTAPWHSLEQVPREGHGPGRDDLNVDHSPEQHSGSRRNRLVREGDVAASAGSPGTRRRQAGSGGRGPDPPCHPRRDPDGARCCSRVVPRDARRDMVH